MKMTISLSALLVACTLVCCSSSKKSSGDDPALTVEVKKLTAQDSYPGVESNLRKTRTYRTEFSTNITEEVVFVSMLVDSVRIPIYSMRIDGDIVSNDAEKRGTLFGEFENISISVSRHFYNEDSFNQMVEPIEYELSGVNVPEGHAFLEYDHFGKLKTLDLGKIEALKTEYHQ